MLDKWHLNKHTLKIIERDHKVISQCLTREYPFIYKKARGVYLYSSDNRKYLDFAAGVAVMNTGNTNKEVVRAIKKQLNKGLHAGFADFYCELPVSFVEKLREFLPSKLNQAFLSNSGTESVEAAYKMARWHTNKKYVIAFKNCFHGRTMGSLSMTNSKPVQRERYNPFLPVIHVPYPNVYHFDGSNDECTEYCLDKLERAAKSVKKNLAAVFIEPIQGEGGYVVPPKKFVKGVREVCNKYDALMVDDEVQAGCYRTGRFLAIEHFKVIPDIVCLSKAIGAGLPMGVTIANSKFQKWPSGSHANTMGGNLLACAAGIANLDYMKKKKIGKNAEKIGNYIKNKLEPLKDRYDILGDIRGIGLMIGLEFVKDKKTKKPVIKERDKIIHKSFEKGLILLPCGESTIRLCPPLIINKRQVNKALKILEKSIREIDKNG